jgi:hypothetical protein
MPALPNSLGSHSFSPLSSRPRQMHLHRPSQARCLLLRRPPPAEVRRRNSMVSALAAPPQQMTSPWQAVGAAVNGAADGYLDRQTQARSSRPLGRRSPSRMVFRVRSSPPT